MTDRHLSWTIVVVATLAAVMFSWLLARAGEPQSVWLWRDVMGLIR